MTTSSSAFIRGATTAKRCGNTIPDCARWTNGWWSYHFSRSGWCPGDIVLPHQIDATDVLQKGKQKLLIKIENMRPKDENNNFGVWKVSAYVVGWKQTPLLWQNW